MKTKTTINGKSYETITATKIASNSNSLSYNDPRHMSETLYKTPKGEYLLSGEGGPATVYALHASTASYGGSRIRLLTPNQALRWLEKHQKIDALEREFGNAAVFA